MLTIPAPRRTLHQSSLWALDPRLVSLTGLPSTIHADLSSRLRLAAKGDALATAGGQQKAVDPTTHLGHLALIDIAGPLSHQPSLFRLLGCTNEATLPEIAGAVRQAAADTNVRHILLRIASPGGTVAGTADVVDAVYEARQQKPTTAYIADLGASAAYWIASQAQTVICNRTARVGSIGAFAVLADQSAAAKEVGIRFHLISSAPHKGAGFPGVEVSEDQIKALQDEIDFTAELFLRDLVRGRAVSMETVRGWHTGKCFIGEQGVGVGLVDRVEGFEVTLAGLMPSMGDSRRAEELALELRQVGGASL